MAIICQSCGMPMEDSSVHGTDSDGSLNSDYCIYCYKGGSFLHDVSMNEFIDMCSQFGEQAGMTNEQMRAFCIKLFPTLKRWQRFDYSFTADIIRRKRLSEP